MGANLITSLEDDVIEARLCKANYQYLRNQMLEAGEWSFAIKRAKPAKLADEPVYQYSYKYKLPNDCLRVLNVVDADGREVDEYVVEGDAVLTNDSDIYIRYLREVVDPSRFSHHFANALAYRLAAEIAIPLTESRTLNEQLYSIFTVLVRDALNTDNMQGRAETKRSGTSLISSRY